MMCKNCQYSYDECNIFLIFFSKHSLLVHDILRMNGNNLTKYCIRIFIDKIYLGFVNRHFRNLFNRVTALD